MKLQRVAANSPSFITNRLRGTIIDSVFYHIRNKFRSPETVNIHSPAGTFPLIVYDDWRMKPRIENGDYYEPVLMEELKQHAESTKCFYDIGARWGLFSKYMLHLTPTGMDIHAFEPDEYNVSLLNRNLEDSNVDIINKYVSDTEKSRYVTIDNYADRQSPPDLVKIDVDGSELSVIKGMSKLISKHSPIIYIEVHPQLMADHGEQPGELFDIFEESEYSIQVCRDHRTRSSWELLNDAKPPESKEFLIRATQDA